MSNILFKIYKSQKYNIKFIKLISIFTIFNDFSINKNKNN